MNVSCRAGDETEQRAKRHTEQKPAERNGRDEDVAIGQILPRLAQANDSKLREYQRHRHDRKETERPYAHAARRLGQKPAPLPDARFLRLILHLRLRHAALSLKPIPSTGYVRLFELGLRARCVRYGLDDGNHPHSGSSQTERSDAAYTAIIVKAV